MIVSNILLALFNIGLALGQFLECTVNEECLAKDAACNDNICECPNGKIFSLDGSQCLDLVFAYDSPCVESQQCAWLLGNHQCLENKCRCARGWIYFNGRCVKKSSVKEECSLGGYCFDGFDVLAMVCKNNICECNDGYYLRGNYNCRPISELNEYCSLNSDCAVGACKNSKCIENSNSPNEDVREREVEQSEFQSISVDDIECEFDVDCSILPNSICNSHLRKCLCKHGYRFISDKCVPELGTYFNCNEDTDCPIKYSRCVDGSCYCRKSYFSVNGNFGCQKPMTHDNLFCNNNERCFVLGDYGVCDNNMCRCSTKNPPSDDFVCDINVCQYDEDCSDTLNSICVDAVCMCPENYHLSLNVCVPDLGASCSENAPCIYPSADCHNGICSCNDDHIQEGQTCLKLAQAINDRCTIQKQCDLVPNTECNNNICQCRTGYAHINTTCELELKMKDRCTTTSDCRIFLGDEVVCRNGICNCPVDMVINAMKDNCVSSSISLSVSFSLALIISVFNLLKLI
ncbi:hypothetical protein FQR65_LT13578 [Abscondita terminalis]|nr:hypothetical protein FQR65_LT13578 [Abscondita terminalis]